ncbi:MAG TPA: aldehyde dehydrogenase family protein [Streptosporangiaceae bacterium]|jgi:aldehyde dehydrogenase (NAD+)|nr:aldehyde dehydrogenase family protein [Streptosporangiaceae bacterium]
MTFTSVNPHDPADVLGEWEAASFAEADAAVSRALKAAQAWRDTPGAARAKALSDAATALEQRAAEVTDLVIREVGKPVSEARGEVGRGVAILRYYAQEALAPDGETLPAAQADQLLMARHLPVGVAALLTPWNFPVAIPLWKAAPSLAYGNATMLKPSSAAAATGLLLGEILGQFLPADVFQVVLGGAQTAGALIDHPGVAAVSFTGSSAVGRDISVRAARRGGRVQAEMGGQNPSIVLADADLDRAAKTIAYAAMGYAGQKCTATSRVIVVDEVYRPFRERLVAAIEALKVLDPADPATLVGPVIDEGSRAAALTAVAGSGGRILTGGKPLDAPGYYLAPTLVELDQPVGPLADEEVFAPVTALIRAGSTDDAIAIGNAVRYGLVASVFTSDLGNALRLTRRVEAGMVRVNAPTSGVDFNAPFGGAKDSSYGPREQGKAARAFYTESRTVLIVP